MTSSLNHSGVVLSHSGRQHSYRVAAALQAADLLQLFFTSSYYKRDLYPDRLARLIPSLDRWLEKRCDPAIDPARVRRFPLLEVPELSRRLLGPRGAHADDLVERRDMRFDDLISRKLHEFPARAFWGFQGSCLHSLEAARSAGMKSVAEFASIPVQVSRSLLQQSTEGLEESSESESSREHHMRQEAEPAAADVCVAASTFSARCLQSSGVPAQRIEIIPLGVDVRKFPFGERQQSGPLRVLFVGKLGRHKGLGYLLGAMKQLASGTVLLTLVGPSVGEDRVLESFREGVDIRGALGAEELLRAYASHDVLVLPSLYEGFGLVILEAMSAGMPVIATANSCAPDVVREGTDGFVVPAMNSAAIAERIDWFATHRGAIPDMGRHAYERALEFSWEEHARRVRAFARQFIGGTEREQGQ